MKFVIVIVCIIVSLSLVYGIDRITSENPSDAAAIYVGLSNSDSSGCDACFAGGEYYTSGCKRCSQDGIVFHVISSQNNPYLTSWSNNQGIHHGDSSCDGSSSFSLYAQSGDTYWIEIAKSNLIFEVTMYDDPLYLQKQESLLVNMCSNPTDLQYFRISTEDGKPSSNGGRIIGYVDDIELWNDISKENFDKTSTPKLNKNFSDCNSKTCNEWILQDQSMLYVDAMNEFFYFDSQVSGTNNNAHMKIDSILDDSWILRFKFHIDEIQSHPAGKGILQIDPQLERILFVIIGIIAISSVTLWEFKIKNERKN